MRWVNIVTSCSLEIVLPSGAGYWLDTKLGSLPLVTVVGLLLGLAAATYHLTLAIRSESGKHKDED